ncbi:MAG: flavin reductase family protein [Acidobacteria bacterium]|nr:flavin reductase family protein [Acidobacteriota bacterium]
MPRTGKQAPATVSRRVWLGESAGLVALGCFGGLRPAAGMGRPPAVAKRRLLPEPGPMLPPVPAILLTVNGKPGDPDEISVVWTFVICGKPPQIGISVGHQHLAEKLVDLHKEFVLNVPVASVVQAFDKVDMNSSKVGDKFKLSGLTRGKAVKVNAPTVEESPIHVECKVFHTLDVPPARTMFLAEVVATSVHEGACDEKGRLIVSAVPFFGMSAGSGEFYTMGKLVGHIGQTVGRTDIKY